jgi:hypothetical protein
MLKIVILISLKNHKRSIINWIVNLFSFLSPIIKFHCSNWWCFKSPFAYLAQPWIMVLFFKCPFCLSNVHYSFPNWKDFKTNDYKSNSTWNWWNSLINAFEHICLKCSCIIYKYKWYLDQDIIKKTIIFKT